jgi:hypothetical protein
MHFLYVYFSGIILVLFGDFVAVLSAMQACFRALTCSGHKPLSRQYSLNSTADSVAVSNVTENLSSLDHLSDALIFGTFRPEILNGFCQLYRVERLMPSCYANLRTDKPL